CARGSRTTWSTVASTFDYW
nr:immunoglobulin heavy chain junction region [Macaca mulatta]MOV45875.1 immunoglobulin heavy chain junction region [Macaca mulatta]